MFKRFQRYLMKLLTDTGPQARRANYDDVEWTWQAPPPGHRWVLVNGQPRAIPK